MAWRDELELPDNSVLQNPSQVLDLEKYDLEGLRSDVSEILSLTGAIQAIALRALGAAAVMVVGIYLLFVGRTSGVGLVLILLLAIVLAGLAAVALAVFLVLRSRVAQTTKASSRVVEIVELIHADYEDFRGGGAEASAKAIGSEIAQHIVLPAAFGMAGRAAFFAGPLGMLLKPALKFPQQWVEDSVASALGDLPDTALATSNHRIKDEVAGDASGTGAATEELDGIYGVIQNKLESTVGVLGRGAMGSVGVVVAVSFVPLALLLIAAWLAT